MTAISHTICHSARDEAGGPILLFRIKGCNCQLIFCVSSQSVLDAIDMHTPSTPPPWPFSPSAPSSSSLRRDSSRGWRKNVYTSITAHAVTSMSLALESTVPILSQITFFSPSKAVLSAITFFVSAGWPILKVFFWSRWLCQPVKFQVLIFCNEEFLYNLSFTDFLSSRCQLIVSVRWKFDKNIEGLPRDSMSLAFIIEAVTFCERHWKCDLIF